MSHFNMPPGVSTNDIPGNVHPDACEVCEQHPINKVCQAIQTAEVHTEARNCGQYGSAVLALEDARNLHLQGRDEDALKRALASIRYSVGIFHPDYQALLRP